MQAYIYTLCANVVVFRVWIYYSIQVGLYSVTVRVRHCLHSDSASPKPGKRRRATLIIFVMAQCR